MAVIFPKWSNRAPWVLVLLTPVGGLFGAAAAWYYFSPGFTDVGYRPRQPVPFSHRLHAGELEIDCRYCHSAVETSAQASLPPTQTCMNCHRLVARDKASLETVRNSAETGEPLRWVRVHNLPDYAYFNHSIHIAAGVGCSSCHGDVTQMEEIYQVKPLSMGWCLDCHRDASAHIRPRAALTDAQWQPDPGVAHAGVSAGPLDCSACHR